MTIQEIKQRFFLMRNGVVADTLRKAGSPFSVIFGLNMPQIVDIAKEITPDADLARELWANSTSRESQLLAPMVMPRDAMSVEEAGRWLDDVATPEVADVLCLRLIRHLPWAWQLADERKAQYSGIRLVANLTSSDPARALAYAEEVLASHPSQGVAIVANMVKDDAAYLLDSMRRDM